MGACLIGRALTPCARATAALLLMRCGEFQGRPNGLVCYGRLAGLGWALTSGARATAAVLLMPCGEVQGRPSFELMGWFVMGASRDVSEAVRT